VPELPPGSHPRRSAFAFIFVTVLLDMLALGIIIPVLPGLIVTMTGGDTASAARIFGLFGVAWAAMQFVFSPVIGGLSDRFGRRPVIIGSNVGLGLSYLLLALAPSLGWLLVARIVSGIASSSISAANAYVADVLPPDRRAAAFGRLGAAFGLGFIIGPAAGGLLGATDPRLPFWVAAGLSLANGCYGLLVLPESLAADRRSRFEWRKANPLGSLKLLRSHRELLGLAGGSFLGMFAHYVLPSTLVLYVMYRYGWSERDVGFLMSGVGLSSMIVQAGFVAMVVRRFGERPTALAGLAFGSLGFLAYAVAPTGPWFMLGVPLLSLWGLYGPAAMGLMTRQVDPADQGKLQGANASLSGIAGMSAPLVFTGSFAAFIAPASGLELPGAPFLIASALLVAAWLVISRATRATPVSTLHEADLAADPLPSGVEPGPGPAVEP
jgi:DHA1 family tetracycline resistance protein-like MFS transporter